MEASAPGRGWRGWRRARVAGSWVTPAATLLLLSAFLVRSSLSVEYFVRLPRGFRLTQETVKIVGSPNNPEEMSHSSGGSVQSRGLTELIPLKAMREGACCSWHLLPTVSVYVMLHQKSPHVLCVTKRLRNAELIDPSFQWHGPKGKIISENSTAQVTSTGSLVFQNFDESMSGVYTCFLEYKPTVEEIVKSLELKYIVYVSSLDTEKGPKPCTDHQCESSRRLSKAKTLIERFFNQQVEAIGRRSEPLPEIYYIEGTLQMVWINRCFPGYGMNVLKHPKCPECCVICSPGSYNPRDGTHCLQCNSSLVYGAKACV
ncbi:zona pellucida-binding protein 1 isoform X2 [Perognathus longimembris pacificus]|uniref:zona pellucida-binding protein 1 isoform X2 n=1 Tax=Perognathus longimembris pacificus TaxID=214514 RepID=UPI002019D0C3|nr:zona pellucida-binding protein 1 isoform X2 [Perognathus longimembris pacificus]